MRWKRILPNLFVLGVTLCFFPFVGHTRTKLVALPERGETIICLDNPQMTLIEEERVLTLQKGMNDVDFSWNGVSIIGGVLTERSLP